VSEHAVPTTYEAPPTTEEASPPTETLLDESHARLLRALADADNQRKRYERRLSNEADAERRRVVGMWLPIVDDLERALAHANEPGSALSEGVRFVYDHALEVLGRLGFTRFDDVGRLFDPARDEASGAIDSEEPPGTVIATVQPGYESADDILRPARVIVARPPG
jgi:molecular chaperone GrpE